MTAEDYRYWRNQARRHSRRADEADDLLHDCLLAAIRAGRHNLEEVSQRRWFAGVLRNQATMTARTAARRRQREAFSSPTESTHNDLPAPGEAKTFLAALTPACRQVALLALHGMNRREIAWALDLSDAALRQRLRSLRLALADIEPTLAREALALAYTGRRRAIESDLEFGLIRRALGTAVRAEKGVGSHDPDGHLFVVHLGRPHKAGVGGNNEA